MALISKEYVATVAEAVAVLDTEDTRARYRAGDFPRADVTQDVNKRYRWDLWWSIPREVRYGVLDAHPGVLDSHLDTMLRKVVPAL